MKSRFTKPVATRMAKTHAKVKPTPNTTADPISSGY